MGFCLSELVYNMIIQNLTFWYPVIKTCKCLKEGKIEKIWVIFFLIVGVFNILEPFILFPILFPLRLCFKRFETVRFFNMLGTVYRFVKSFVALWLYHADYRGALWIDQHFGNIIDQSFMKINPILNKILPLIKYPQRDVAAKGKKSE